MKPSRVAEVVEKAISTEWPLFIWGPPGCGKSSIVRSAAQHLDVPIRDVRASLLDPTDLRGIPVVDGDRARWCPPTFLPRPEESPGVLFFDELNAAPPLVQASLYQLVLDRRVGEYELPKHWSIIAAGNRSEDRSVVFRMPAALANRFIHVDCDIDYADWRNWATRSGVAPLIIAFLALRVELLHDMSTPDRAFPTPRSWEVASRVLRHSGSLESCLDILVGVVGEAATRELHAFCADTITADQIAEILRNPAVAKLPKDLGSLYALVAYLASSLGRDGILPASEVLLRRLPIEFAVLLVRDALRFDPNVRKLPGYASFLASNAALLATHA